MAESRVLLRESDLTIEGVATSVGYRQPSYFIKHFRREHMVTPAAWRRRRALRTNRAKSEVSAAVPSNA
ncbi:MAG: helix-turn-helix domain-containing protein [Solirubrobacteraceae bacterium]